MRGARGGLLLVVLASAVLVLAMAAPAYAIVIDTEGEVFSEKCTPCHAQIADSQSSEIIFKHAYHLLISCSSCHSEFPHRPEGTDSPKMRECWNCHDLRHGPQGLIADGECDACHRTPESQLRPSFHTSDWAEEPHVQPANERLRTECAMCHKDKEADCDDCHEDEFVEWEPTEEMTFDIGDGCLACHGDVNLTKISNGEPKSFTITGVQQSAHADLGCTECHQDFNFEGGEDPTNLWAVNAGLACMDCHAEEEDDAQLVAEYKSSIHGTELANGNYDSATCSSCHGGHFIERLDTDAARDALHGAGYRICARCHAEEWESYDDYYHGAAYKAGASDAPSCWDCHDDHGVLPSSNASSSVSPERLPESCGGSLAEGQNCHGGDRSTEAFTEAAGELIHQKAETRESNPLLNFISNVFGWL